MTLRPFTTLAAVAIASLVAVMPFEPAGAWTSSSKPSTSSMGPHCKTGTGNNVTINKPVTINTNVSIYKPVTINNNVTVNKDVNVWNNVDIQKDININNNVNINKNINIEKNITINNNGGSASATATASAAAQSSSASQAAASARALTGATTSSGGGGYFEENYYRGVGGDVGNIQTSGMCEMQDATVVKAIHAVCVAPDGREFPASHMVPATFIDASYEGEIARCIPGARLKLVIGDVLQSDQGMAGTYEHGATLVCGDHEAVRHYKNGMLKCEAALPVKDCTERTNLRKYGTGDMFFSYRTQVCVTPARSAQRSAAEVTGMTLDGGVGDGH